MPTPITHALVAIPLNITMMGRKNSWKIFCFSVLCSILPDIDLVSFYLGVDYADFWGHRGFTHSIFFVFLAGLSVVLIFFREIKIKSKKFIWLLANFFLLGLAHIILDAMTSGGRGVAFFSPISNARYFFPWTPIAASPLSAKYFFILDILEILKFELLYLIIPALAYTALFILIKRMVSKIRKLPKYHYD